MLCVKSEWMLFTSFPQVEQVSGLYQTKKTELSSLRFSLVLLQTAGDRYCHEQVFVLESEVDAVPEEEKMGVLAGYGGTYTLARYGKRVNPGTTLASSMVGWHSGKDVARLGKDCRVIGAREHDVGGVTYFSPDVKRDHGKDARKIGRMEQLYRSWENGSWRKRCQKYLSTQPFSQGFIFKGACQSNARYFWLGKKGKRVTYEWYSGVTDSNLHLTDSSCEGDLDAAPGCQIEPHPSWHNFLAGAVIPAAECSDSSVLLHPNRLAS